MLIRNCSYTLPVYWPHAADHSEVILPGQTLRVATHEMGEVQRAFLQVMVSEDRIAIEHDPMTVH